MEENKTIGPYTHSSQLEMELSKNNWSDNSQSEMNNKEENKYSIKQ